MPHNELHGHRVAGPAHERFTAAEHAERKVVEHARLKPQHRDETSHPDLDHFLEQRNDRKLPHRDNHNSTNPLSAFKKDDRPPVVEQDSVTKRWRAYRDQDGIPGRMICDQVESREIANEHVDRDRTWYPRTLKKGSRSSFGPPSGGWPDLKSG